MQESDFSFRPSAPRPSRLEQILERLGGERRIHYSLDRFKNALAAIGNPEKNVQTLVVAGTNGKGTTSLFISAALTEAGFSVGTFLSPHLQSPAERFLLDMVPANEARLSSLAEELEAVAVAHNLTYFEFLTLLVFVWARRQNVDFLVLEVGLGGRLDATNVTRPLACAITTIDWDHQEYLGNSLAQILDEKMGVLREESLVFSGLTDPSLKARLERRCAELDAIYYYASELRKERHEVDWGGQSFSLNGYPFRVSNPSLGTIDNAAVAFLLLRIVFPKLPVSVCQRAFARIRTPGRMELVQANPRVVLSGDHNLQGMRGLLDSLDRLGFNRHTRGARKLNIVCGFSPDKPYVEMYRMLQTVSDRIWLTEIARGRGKMPADYRDLGRDSGPFEAEPARAVRQALAHTGPDDILVITGSLYLIGEVRSWWHSSVEFLEGPPTSPGPTARPPGRSNRAKVPRRAPARTLAPQTPGAAP